MTGTLHQVDDVMITLGPLLSPAGGIQNLSDLIMLKDFLQKSGDELVNRCICCNILINTDETILNKFLEEDGWTILNTWLREANQTEDYTMLMELVKVFHRCPVNLARLKLNDTPRLLKLISKCSDKTLARTTKTLIEEWKRIVTRDDDQLVAASVNLSDESTEMRKKKRKEAKMEDVDKITVEKASFKKLKLRDENLKTKADSPVGNNILNSSLAVNNENSFQMESDSVSNDSLKLDSNACKEEKVSKSVTTSSSPAIKTAKVKLGKARSIGVLGTEQTHNRSPSAMSFGRDSARLISPTASAHSSFAMNRPHGERAPIETGIRLIDPKPLPPPTLVAQKESNSKHVIKESAGFMDAISSIPKPTKKKRKQTALNTSFNGDSNGVVMHDSALGESIDSSFEIPRRSSIDSQNDDTSKSNQILTSEASKDNADNNEITTAIAKDLQLHSSSSSTPPPMENEFLTYCEKPFDPFKAPGRGILTIVQMKPILTDQSDDDSKTKRKQIRWADEGQMVKMVYFELDEQERCNVFKQGQRDFAEHRAQEMRSEKNVLSGQRSRAQQSLESALNAQLQSTCVEYFPWKLILIDLPPNALIREDISEEKKIQADRFKTVLPNIYLPGQLPDFPSEPDTTDSNSMLSSSSSLSDTPKLIPLEDENVHVRDYSNYVLPVTSTVPNYSSTTAEPTNSGIINDGSYPLDNPAFGPLPTAPQANTFVPPVTTGTSPYADFNPNVSGAFSMAPSPFNAPMTHHVSPTTGSFSPDYMAMPSNNVSYGQPQVSYGSPSWDNGWGNLGPPAIGPISSSPGSLPPPAPQHPPFNGFAANGRPMHKTVCRFWAKNKNCKYASNCNFIHANPGANAPAIQHYPSYPAYGMGPRIRDKIR